VTEWIRRFHLRPGGDGLCAAWACSPWLRGNGSVALVRHGGQGGSRDHVADWTPTTSRAHRGRQGEACFPIRRTQFRPSDEGGVSRLTVEFVGISNAGMGPKSQEYAANSRFGTLWEVPMRGRALARRGPERRPSRPRVLVNYRPSAPTTSRHRRLRFAAFRVSSQASDTVIVDGYVPDQRSLSKEAPDLRGLRGSGRLMLSQGETLTYRTPLVVLNDRADRFMLGVSRRAVRRIIDGAVPVPRRSVTVLEVARAWGTLHLRIPRIRLFRKPPGTSPP